MLTRTLLAATALCSVSVPLHAQATKQKPEKEKLFTLENLFPKKGIFGPSASGMAFSHDGRYAAWLWRPYQERRHGSDIWLFDVRSGKKTRVTSASVLAEWQAATRKVVEDRKAKAKKKKTKTKTKKDAKKEQKKDADDEKAPRYSGVRSIEWSPVADEMLFVSLGDIYRYAVKTKSIERLTQTKKTETAVHYLPDGKGYTYLVDGALIEVRFGSHVVRQLDPTLPAGETMVGYELSPDGKRLVFMSRKGSGRRGGSRKVKIASYRGRFMDVREVPRHVSDDPMPPTEVHLYVLDLEGRLHERTEPVRFMSRRVEGPRDVLRTPDWSPDSSRVVFSVFAQKTQHIELRELRFEAAKKAAMKAAKKAAKQKPKDKKSKPATAESHVIYRFLHEGGPTTPRMMHPRYLADSRHVVFLSEQTGFRHLHVLDPTYESQVPITTGHFEVYPIDVTKDHRTMFVEATKEHPARRDVYAVDLEKRTMKRLTTAAGTYARAAVSPDGRHVLATFSRFGTPRELVHVDTRSRRQRTLTSSHPKQTLALAKRRPKFFSYDNRHGQRIWGYLFKPDGWSKNGRYPLLVYVYGGPLGTRKNVVEGNYGSDGYFFNQYMTREHGYLTCVIDPRGMSGYGGLFEKANFERVGKPQVEDLVDGVKHLVADFGADKKRVGIYGWSFGGFQTQMCMYTAPETFQVGMAGAGPTEWENYNSWYSTGTIGKSRTGKTDLAKYSLLPLAKNLEGHLLLVHGMEDSNVLYQDTVRVYRELLKAGKETLVELFLDPTGSHGLGGDVKRLGKARKYESFLLRTLGEGKPKHGRNLTVRARD